MDSPLTDRGLAQGQILAAHLRNPADCQILTSPQPRAALTAQIAFSEIDTTALNADQAFNAALALIRKRLDSA